MSAVAITIAATLRLYGFCFSILPSTPHTVARSCTCRLAMHLLAVAVRHQAVSVNCI
jgi:hypothetical protein